MLFKMPIDDTHQARLILHSRDAATRRRIARRDERKRADAAAADRARHPQHTVQVHGDTVRFTINEPAEATAKRMDALIMRAFNAHAMVRVEYFPTRHQPLKVLDGCLDGYLHNRKRGTTEIHVGSGWAGDGWEVIDTGTIHAISILAYTPQR